jgi:predicted phosphodiesterase
VVCVQGNHDRHVAQTYAEPDLWQVADGVLQWRHHNARLLTAEDAAFLAALPEALAFELDGVRYGMTHLYQDYQLILSRHAYRAFCAARFGGGVERLIVGHTHRQAVVMLGERELWLNPGSVSYRRQDDPDQEAHYMVIEDGRILMRSAPYDLGAVYAEAIRHPLSADELRVARWFFGPR